MKRLAFSIVVTTALAQAAVTGADSTRGAELFTSLRCVGCHSINGQGGKAAPDLGVTIDRGFTPASLAATMWNHAPTMWGAMRSQGIQAGKLDAQGAADLIAFFYSRRYFDKPGDAARGKAAFASKHCADCHGIADSKNPDAKPVMQWHALGRPIELANAMWNHATQMKQQFAAKHITWPDLTSQNLTDMLVYLRNLPPTRSITAGFEVNAGGDGAQLFQAKGCADCHKDAMALEPRLKDQNLTDIAVDLWNHAPKMPAQTPPLDLEEMRSIVSYFWARNFFVDSGNAAAGSRVFTTKRCIVCHSDASSGAPGLPAAGRTFDGPSMISVLWSHGPQMMQSMNSKNITWPRFQAVDMSNLIAFLNSKN